LLDSLLQENEIVKQIVLNLLLNISRWLILAMIISSG